MNIVIYSGIERKLWEKHQVRKSEVIEAFVNRLHAFAEEVRPGRQKGNPRYWFISETNQRRRLKVVFAIDPFEPWPVLITAYEPNKQEIRVYARIQKIDRVRKLVNESEDWTSGRRGAFSRRVSEADEKVLEARLGLRMISIRLPIMAIDDLKKRARSHGMKYQPYLRSVLMRHLAEDESLETRVMRLEKKVKP